MEAPECCPPEIYEIMRQVKLSFVILLIIKLGIIYFIVYTFVGMGLVA